MSRSVLADTSKFTTGSRADAPKAVAPSLLERVLGEPEMRKLGPRLWRRSARDPILALLEIQHLMVPAPPAPAGS